MNFTKEFFKLSDVRIFLRGTSRFMLIKFYTEKKPIRFLSPRGKIIYQYFIMYTRYVRLTRIQRTQALSGNFSFQLAVTRPLNNNVRNQQLLSGGQLACLSKFTITLCLVGQKTGVSIMMVWLHLHVSHRRAWELT